MIQDNRILKALGLSLFLMLFWSNLNAYGMNNEEVDAGRKVVSYPAQPGDTVKNIAEHFNVDLELIQLINGLTDNSEIKARQVLRIPNEQSIVHRVKKGETISDIAGEYNVSVGQIMEENEFNSVDELKIGQEIAISVPLIQTVFAPTVSRGGNAEDFSWPLDGVISSFFGSRNGKKHTGLDIAANYGEPIRAANSGTVIFAGRRGNFGKAVYIKHDFGYITIYAHTSKILVDKGERVTAGQIIAEAGSTGNSTGPHLHFEIRKNNVSVNPLNLLPQKR